MGEIVGVLAAVLSSGLGGTCVGATRFLAGAVDPLALGALRFGFGFLFLLPAAFLGDAKWPPREDWPGVIGLGVLFFGLFPILFNASLVFTTSARGALALSTLPLLTMIAGAILGVEQLTARKTAGVFVAMIGVATALLSGLASVPSGAWRGDLLMVAGAVCMALSTVWSKPFIRRCGALPFTAIAMGVGATALIVISLVRDGFTPVLAFGQPQWLAVTYLAVVGRAVTYFLWAFALARTTPTRVAISVAVNPVTAALVGAHLLREPLQWNLAAGVVMVFAGIWIANTVQASGATRGEPPQKLNRDGRL